MYAMDHENPFLFRFLLWNEICFILYIFCYYIIFLFSVFYSKDIIFENLSLSLSKRRAEGKFCELEIGKRKMKENSIKKNENLYLDMWKGHG